MFLALWAVKRKDGVGQGVFISKSQAWHIDSVPLGLSCRIHRFCRQRLVSLSPSPDRAGGREQGGFRGGGRAFPRFRWVAAQGRAEAGVCGVQLSLPRRTGRPGRGVLSEPCFCLWVKSGALFFPLSTRFRTIITQRKQLNARCMGQLGQGYAVCVCFLVISTLPWSPWGSVLFLISLQF